MQLRNKKKTLCYYENKNANISIIIHINGYFKKCG